MEKPEVLISINVEEFENGMRIGMSWEPNVTTLGYMLHCLINSMEKTDTGCLERDAICIASRCLERIECMIEQQKAAESKPCGVGSQPHSELFKSIAGMVTPPRLKTDEAAALDAAYLASKDV